jgi:hypothetical protein
VIPGYHVSRFNLDITFEDGAHDVLLLGYRNAGTIGVLIDLEVQSLLRSGL